MQRTFYDWSKPALEQAVDHLCRDWHSGPLDLRNCLIIVPTRHAGRRLRERLALRAASRKTGVLLGHVEKPGFLFEPPTDPRPVATGVAANLLWRRILEQHAGLLLPVSRAASEGDARAREAAAAHICSLRDLLCEEGYSLVSFSAALEAAFPEDAPRWQALAALEQIYAAEVAGAGWRDDSAEKLARVEGFRLPAGVTRVVVLFTPDPAPLAISVLRSIARHATVEICIHAPVERQSDFDDAGRPLTDRWCRGSISLSEQDVEVCDTTITVAERIRSMIHALDPEARRQVVAGAGDASTVSRLRSALARDGISTFDPGGIPASRLSLFALTRRLLDLAGDGGIDAVERLIRHPIVLHAMERITGQQDHVLPALDEFLNERMPVDLPAFLGLARVYQSADRGFSEIRTRAVQQLAITIDQWIATLAGEPLSVSLPALLGKIVSGWPVDDAFEKESNLLGELFARLALIEPLCQNREDSAEALRQLMQSQMMTSRRKDQDVEILGWLELSWEDAPTLLLADLHDGIIPESIDADAFLPDGVRTRLKLRDNRQRLARDAYQLEVLTRSRQPGKLRGFVARKDARGDLIKPSRLLFLCEADRIPARALQFFGDGKSSFVPAGRKPAWLISGPPVSALDSCKQLSVSLLNQYLRCPFRFYLQQAAHLGDPYVRQQELDPQNFGTLVHDVFLAFARSPVAHVDDPKSIESFLHNALDDLLHARFGDRPGVALIIQRDVLRQRLSYAAQAQASWRGQGWKIDPAYCERLERLPVGPNVISLKVDRVDVHEKTGEVCVIDYKTSQTAQRPQSAHIKAVKSGLSSDLQFAAAPGEESRWINLQLPVYAAVARKWFDDPDGTRIRAAYFSLPGTVSNTAISLWEDFTPDHIRSALFCAEAIFDRIRQGVFWPPVEEYEEEQPGFQLFYESIREHLDPETLRALSREEAR